MMPGSWIVITELDLMSNEGPGYVWGPFAPEGFLNMGA
jgi:hypothetical protein